MDPQFIYVVVPQGHMIPAATFTSYTQLIDFVRQEYKLYKPYIYRMRDGAQYPQDNYVYHGIAELLS